MQENNRITLSYINVSHSRIKDWDALSIGRIFGGNDRMRHIRYSSQRGNDEQRECFHFRCVTPRGDSWNWGFFYMGAPLRVEVARSPMKHRAARWDSGQAEPDKGCCRGIQNVPRHVDLRADEAQPQSACPFRSSPSRRVV